MPAIELSFELVDRLRKLAVAFDEVYGDADTNWTLDDLTDMGRIGGEFIALVQAQLPIEENT